MVFLKLLAGLSVFLLALSNLEVGLSKASGRTFEHILARFTKNHFLSVITGIVTTAFLQSSSVVTLITLAFVGASLLPFSNALGVIIGANLGTTFTGWIVSVVGFKMELDLFIYPLLSFGCFYFFLPTKYKKTKNFFMAIFSFGLLLFGLDIMKVSMSFVSSSLPVESLREMGIVVYFLFGIVFTAIIQSSSATMMIALTALSQGIITLDGACALVIGADLGTTGTTILGAVGGSQDKKRIAAAHVTFNLVTDLLALLFIFPLIKLAKMIVGDGEELFTLVFFHSSFNLIGILIFFPFLNRFEKFLMKIVPEKKGEKFFNLDTLFATTAHLSLLKDALQKFGDKVGEYLMNIGDSQKGDRSYENLKEMSDEIFTYILKVKEQHLTESEQSFIIKMNTAMNEILNSLKDAASIEHNLINFRENIDPNLKNFYFLQKKIMAEILGDKQSDTKTLLSLIKASRTSSDEHIVEMVSSAGSFSGISTLFNVNREVHSSLSSFVSFRDEMAFGILN
ncbi:putative Na/Pi-cotransporter II-like protein [Bacteriovorax sp. BSW11_IV]|uniref:Na/Pi cotransporter family protein n=1 Tax=Bacteriovorax sp. BSW11_IV TaxID=1353529 RepID=UPI00038A00D3|nr:Na/Pi symporter [Bacteriovorax sp. BSW11_IV]EQC49091.1 putative Na/Pi-cotransporter II-like protein [Bacteriovorax sp. BSW11_IV]